jgi:putative aminopeptidase FrvX
MRKRIIGLLWVILSLSVFCASAPGQTAGSSDWDLFKKIVMIPGVSSHEGKVMDFIQASLPKGFKVQRDTKSDIWFTVGEGSPHILFVAHGDELGWTIEKITPQGTALLKGRAGFLPQPCEARPFVIQTAKGPVDGIIMPRPDYYSQKPGAIPEQYEVYLGVATEKEARDIGVAEGDMVIFKKKIIELSPGIISTRAVDDRAGCASLLAASLELDWTKIRGRTVTFAWSVEEEIGLYGAQAMAKVLKPDAVFAIDTFVSADSPLENKRFGDAKLGGGAVLRAYDTSNITPKTEIRKVMKLAQDRGIPVQVYNSRGGNDGSVFVPGGAVDIPLSWPGTYAHSFIEKIYKSDLEALTRLIKAIAEDWQ